MDPIRKRQWGHIILWSVALLGVVAAAGAQTFSQVLSFQGRLCSTDGKPLPDGPYAVQFTIYDTEVGGNSLWTESQGVTQVGGVFDVYLGSVTAFPTTLFKDGDRWLGVKVGGDPEMAQRFKFAPAPWAIYASDSNMVDGFHASQTPTPNYILPLDESGKFPAGVLPPDADWHLAGNAGTNPPTTFLGTTDSKPLVIKTNGAEAMRIDPTGYVGIGGLPSSYWRLAVSNTSGGAGSFTTTGTGEAGVFQISNTSNSNPAVLATTDGGGEAVKGFTTGSGIAGSFGTNNASSVNPTLLATTNGLGNAAWIRIDGAGNPSAALKTRTFGTGPAGLFEIDNTSNGSAAIETRTNGNGRAIWGYTDKGIAAEFEVTDTTGNGWAVYGHTVGTGSAGVFATTNADNTEPALTAFTWGRGPAGEFYINNTLNGNPAVDAYTNGSGTAVAGRAGGVGIAGAFANVNNANSSPALHAETHGPGTAVRAYSYGEGGAGTFMNWNSDSPSPALVAQTVGTGQAGLFSNQNTSSVSPTLLVQNQGLAEAGVFSNTAGGNFSPALYAESQGTSQETRVICARYVGGAADAVAVYGESVLSDWYGIGGKFEGGFVGAMGAVYPTGGVRYYGLYGSVQGGTGTNYGVYGEAGGSGTNYAGYFSGDVKVVGYLYKDGGGFQIDHPLDPANMYLNHSFVESPDMKNVYDGVEMLDGAGEVWVELPEWFGVLNGDFRYQLTCIGAFAPVYIAEEIADNRFKIAGGAPGMKVSWQVTGIRQDPYAEAHRIPVEELKPPHARGLYEHPELYGRPEQEGVDYATREKAMRMYEAR